MAHSEETDRRPPQKLTRAFSATRHALLTTLQGAPCRSEVLDAKTQPQSLSHSGAEKPKDLIPESDQADGAMGRMCPCLWLPSVRIRTYNLLENQQPVCCRETEPGLAEQNKLQARC